MRSIAQREDVPDLILDAAEQLLARYGYAKMTIDDLAREVGIGKGTVYLHFSSKEEIALAHVDRLVARVLERLRAIAESGGPVAERLTAMLVARVMVRFDAAKHYRESISEKLAAIRTALDARRVTHFAAEAEVFAATIREGEKAGELRKCDEAQVARSFISATNAFLPYSLTPKQLGRRAEIEEGVAGVAELLIHGIAAR